MNANTITGTPFATNYAQWPAVGLRSEIERMERDGAPKWADAQQQADHDATIAAMREALAAK